MTEITERETLFWSVKERILTVTLNRPERMNAFNTQMIDDMTAAIDLADADDEIRAVIVTGAGRAFCAGADLASGGDTFDYASKGGLHQSTVSTSAEGMNWSDDSIRDGGGRISLRFFDAKKPIIGAINGAAVGVGVTMQLPMDVRLASEKARFGFVFARRGIVPEACSSWFLPRLVGVSKALEWTMTGRIFDAEEARAGGLVRSVHAPDDLMAAAQALAREIADNTSAVSVALARQQMWKLLGAAHPMAAHTVDSRNMFWTGRSADAREGIASFLEKRPAQFTDSPARDLPPVYPWWTERKFGDLD